MRAATSSPRPLLAALSAVVVSATAVVAVATVAAPSADAAVTPPGAANTGVPLNIPLRTIMGDVTLNQPGATYANLDIHGRVKVTASNITLANSVVRGNSKASIGPIIEVAASGVRNFMLRDSTVVPQYPSVWNAAGIMGHDFTVLRTEITGTVDAVRVVGGNVNVQRSWLHDTRFYAASQNPLHKDTHNDGVQVESGSNITIAGNTISGNHNAALMVAQDMGPTSGITFTGNWSSGGACTVNLSPTPYSKLAGPVTVTSNQFRHNTSVANCAIVMDYRVVLNQTNNIWADTGGSVRVITGR